MELAVETIVRLSGERARRLGQLAARRGVTEEALVTEALDRLFNESVLSEDDVDDVEMLRRIEAEVGPLPPIRTMPLINPDDIVSVVPVPVRSELLRRIGETR